MLKGAKGVPKRAQYDPKEGQREPKGTPKTSQMEAWDALGRPWGGLGRPSQKRVRGICFSGSKTDRILEALGSIIRQFSRRNLVTIFL